MKPVDFLLKIFNRSELKDLEEKSVLALGFNIIGKINSKLNPGDTQVFQTLLINKDIEGAFNFLKEKQIDLKQIAKSSQDEISSGLGEAIGKAVDQV